MMIRICYGFAGKLADLKYSKGAETYQANSSEP